MKIKLASLIGGIILTALIAMIWLSRYAAHIEDQLIRVDQSSQIGRLMQISLPRVCQKVDTLLKDIRQAYDHIPDLNSTQYAVSPVNATLPKMGHFLLTPYELLVPMEEEETRRALGNAPSLLYNIKRKAASPAAPLLDPNVPVEQRQKKANLMPVFDIVPIVDADPSTPIKMTGEPTPFFAWGWDGKIIYMRQIPTNHGGIAEGVLIDPEDLSSYLLQPVEKGLLAPTLRPPRHGEIATLLPLPLVLDPGDQVLLPDTSARKDALFGAVMSAWVIAVVAIAMILGLLVLYGRLEKKRSSFVSAVTHELRTPLTTFTLRTEMLARGMVPEDKKDEYYTLLYQESLRLAHLVENVLSYSRLTRGKVRGRQDVETCEPLFIRLFDNQKEKLEAEGFKVVIRIAPQCRLLQLRTDLMSLERILTNLTDNAIKYGRSTSPEVQFTVQSDHKEIRIRVRDKGTGISPDVTQRLFKPFNRSAGSESGKMPGIGLGLALSRDLARSIGGELCLEGTSSEGSTFLLTLPAGA